MGIMGFTGDAPMVLYEGLQGSAGYRFRYPCLSSGILAHLPRRHPILLGIVFDTRDGDGLSQRVGWVSFPISTRLRESFCLC